MKPKTMICLVNLFFIAFFALLLFFAAYPLYSPFFDQIRFGADISELAGSRNFDELLENIAFDDITVYYPERDKNSSLSQEETDEFFSILGKYRYYYTPFATNLKGKLSRENRDTSFVFYYENYQDIPPVAHEYNFYTRGVRYVIVLPFSVSVVQRGTHGPELTHECPVIYFCREPALLEEINEFIEKTK